MASEADIRDVRRDPAPALAGSLDPETRRQRWLAFWFYVGVPISIGFLLGWLQVGRSADWPRSVSLLYWLGVSVVTTLLNALATSLVAALLRPLRSPLWLTLIFGQMLGGFLFTNPVLQAYRRWLQANVHPDLVLTPATTLAEFLQRLPSNTLLWVGINLLFFYGLRMPRFGYQLPERNPPFPLADAARVPGAPPTPVEPDGAAGAAGAAAAVANVDSRPSLMERVRADRRGALLALKAEGHYLQVYTDAGTDLILYRLSDALLEVGAEDGAQVHRSWWVAARALSGRRHRDRLTLVNGIEVPVSRSFCVEARRRGWLASTEARDG
jgi:hypothetical protein